MLIPAPVSQTSSVRQGRLKNLFRDSVAGKHSVRTPHDGARFLEAVRSQTSPSQCVEMLVSGASGLAAVRDAVRADLSTAYILSHTLPFLRYLSDPSIKALVDGQLLGQILAVVANPPTLLNALVALFDSHKLPDDSVQPFAWLTLELMSQPPDVELDLVQLTKSVAGGQRFLQSTDHPTRELGYRIQKLVQVRSPLAHALPASADGSEPGGRHDNDFADFRKIDIYPTTDEFLSTGPPYYKTAVEMLEADSETRLGAHLDNQFRLLREDMLAELRDDIQVATGKKSGRRSAMILNQLVPAGVDFSDTMNNGRLKYKPCTLGVKCYGGGLGFLQKLDAPVRKKTLKDQPGLLRHQAFGVLYRGNDILGFAFVDRNIDDLVKSPPVVSLQFTDHGHLRRALAALTGSTRASVQFVLVDTPVFAYEPVLVGLQRLADAPLLDLLVNPSGIAKSDFGIPARLLPKTTELAAMANMLASSLGSERPARVVVTAKRTVELDDSQLRALLLALTTAVSLIQGPPGTGKSFIGALIVRFLFDAGLRVLVLSYTNHALDQFLEDLLEAELPASSMVRLGSKAKSTTKTEHLLLSGQTRGYRRSRSAWEVINGLEHEAGRLGAKLRDAFQRFTSFSPTWDDISDYLDFTEGGQIFLDALRVPTNPDNAGWAQAGKRGKQVGPDYLYQQWKKGAGPGVFAKDIPPGAKPVWNMPRAARDKDHQSWVRALSQEHLEELENAVKEYNKIQAKLETQFGEADAHVMREKKIIGCTTTGAAKHHRLIRAAEPDVILVEEAGEILESHVLTALAPTVKQLVLIGDHQQLRPKINNYALSVEKGDGFDLNRSLFERLILQGTSHATLYKQHRMAPEISAFARELTYPHLLDGPKTDGRPEILGLSDRVVFVNHSRQEDSDKQICDRRDAGMKESKKNTFEAEMVLRCVKYLGQQGYAADRIVVLTPYLGQLRVLRDLLAKNQHDPALSDMDKNELVKAGLISEAAAKLDRTSLRISTIDNYQGEESDIVIASLTRSNDTGDIGFMAAPERLNVLMTRARNGIVLIGNMETFLKSKKGKSTWNPFFDLLKAKGHLYDGLPVYCGKHPDRTALLKEPVDFDKVSPDGGCTEPCDAPLKCGTHKCRSRCHRVVDHSRTDCNQLVERVCDRQHKTKVICSKQKDGCAECIREDKEIERRIRRDLQLETDRAQREVEYTRQLQQIQDEVEHQRRINKHEAEEDLRRQTLEQQRAELDALKDAEKRIRWQNQLKAAAKAKADANAQQAKGQQTPPSSESQGDDWSSGARAEWETMKRCEGAVSKPLDELMEMIGLEEVKQQFLDVKCKIDTALRQGVSMASERFSCSMLGNPGTGKTTVARLYAQLLTELCVIPGSCFKESTGAAMANIGVSGCKTLIDEILNAGGGVLFIDEAYQLTSGNSPGGGAVLDYLLAEVENLRGKVVFVLAGYNKQMESFFAHNPGLPSRFPVDMVFADYTDDELLRILELKIHKKYNGAMECEDGLRGLYCRIVARRIGRGRGKEGFGNAREVENVLDRISRRQAGRLRRARKAGTKPNDFSFTKEDLIGPEPGDALRKCAAWKKLHNDLIGLGSVKQAVQSLVDSIQQNYLRELQEEPLIQYSLNKVFLGNPGTGKTTVAKLYGEILVALGMLSKGEVVVKNPSDFVGAYIGHSEKQTKGILAASLGKVLVIDEAYGLYGGGGHEGNGSAADSFKTAVIDTLVAEVQSVPGDDRCVLLLGYKDQMEKMFQNVNPGLSRRFPVASGFTFDDFSDDELRTILNLKLKQQGYQVTPQAATVAMEMLTRARNRPNFGNGGEIDIMLDATKARHQTRFSNGKANSATVLEALDFDENFDRAESAETNVRMLFEGTVGSEEIVSLLERYQETVRTMKSLEMDPKENIPFNFLFRGPPGTGKTTTARKIGQVFYDMGFLATTEVVECSATDLIGQYVGHTGPKVQQLFDKALGKVLFVDEAYRLGEGRFAKEAMDEIVDSVTKDRYFKKLIIILAGYDADINRLMSVNAGLTSRFPAVIDFRPLTADECVTLMLKLLQKQGQELNKTGKTLDLSCLETPATGFQNDLLSLYTDLAAQPNWASARDVQVVAKEIFNQVLRDKEGIARGSLTLTEVVVTSELAAMLKERVSRASAAKPPAGINNIHDFLEPQFAPSAPPPPPTASTSASTATTTSTTSASHTPPPTLPEEGDPPSPQQKATKTAPAPPPLQTRSKRDTGVSDETWAAVQASIAEAAAREAAYHDLKASAGKAATEAARKEILKRVLEEEERRKKEEEAQRKLKEMGVCPMGYAWVRMEGGWRCEGGSHWVGEGEM